MTLNPNDIRRAIQQLDNFNPQFPQNIHDSTAAQGNRVAVTAFAWFLAMELASVHNATHVAGDFRGGAGQGAQGQVGGNRGVAVPIENELQNRGLKLADSILLDMVLYSNEVLEPLVTLESEADVHQPRGSLIDFEKLLLTRSPKRVYVYRVNVLPRGSQRKQTQVRQELFDRFRAACSSASQLIHDEDEVCLVEIVTAKDPSKQGICLDAWNTKSEKHNFILV